MSRQLSKIKMRIPCTEVRVYTDLCLHHESAAKMQSSNVLRWLKRRGHWYFVLNVHSQDTMLFRSAG